MTSGCRGRSSQRASVHALARASVVVLVAHGFACTRAQHDGNANLAPPVASSDATLSNATGTTSSAATSASGPVASAPAAPRNVQADVKRLMALLAEVSAIHIRVLPSSARATPPPGKTLDERLAGQPNCTLLTEQLVAWDKAYGAELRAIPALTYGEVERDPITKGHMHNQMEVVMTVGSKCRSNPDFQALQQRLRASKP